MSDSPAKLFLEYWQTASQWSQHVALRVMRPSLSFGEAVYQFLLIADGPESYAKIADLVENSDDGHIKGRQLSSLEAIDRFFEMVHPRSLYHSSQKEALPIVHWIRELTYHRRATGAFFQTESEILIPKGTLTRLARGKFDTSAYVFGDLFSYLSVSPTLLTNHGQRIAVRPVAVSASCARGVGTTFTEAGSESIGIIPIAEHSQHLLINPIVRDGVNYLDIRVAESLDVPSLVMEAFAKAGEVDIVVAPELLISEADCDSLSVKMRKAQPDLRMFVAGSGNTSRLSEGQPWNESRVLNKFGVELWRQRKIWQAGLNRERAEELGVFIQDGEILMEDNCAGSEVIVADIEGVGRCVVLICQDLQMNPFAGELIRCYQPDWIFTPILDWGAHAGRWMHQRAWDLSAISPARFVIASSTALAGVLGKNLPSPAGLLVGPKEAIGPDSGRLCTQVYTTGSHPSAGTVQWSVSEWQKSVFGTDGTLKRIV